MVTQFGHILKKGQFLRIVGQIDDIWTFKSVTHPRKVNVYQDENPNGEPSWPNRSSREFYASVFDLGIWDTSAKEWTFTPSWPESVLRSVEDRLNNQ